MTHQFDLRVGDAVQIMRDLEDESFDFIFADPPYHLSNGGLSVKSGKAVIVDKGEWDKSHGLAEDYAFHFEWLKEAKRLLRPNGSIIISGTHHSIYRCGFALETLDFRILNEIVWYKPNAAPNLTGRNFAASHETLIWAAKSRNAKHTFNYELMKKFEAPTDAIKNPGKQMRDVWAIPTTPAREKLHGKHPTQKPLALLQRVILACTQPGDRVLDPFVGSGTTGVAAASLGRNFFGIDREETFVELARGRILSVTGDKHD